MKKNDFYDRTTENNFLLENIQGGIVYSDFDPPFCLRYVTEGMCQLSGYTQEELLDLEQMDIVHPDDADRLIEDVGSQLAVSDIFETEYRLLRKDGSFVYVLDRAKAVAHENGKKYIHCLLTDITCLKQTQQALSRSEEKYKVAIQQSGNVVIEYDLLHDIISFSENYEQVFGGCAPKGTLQSLLKMGWCNPSDPVPFQQAMARVIQTKKPANFEVQVQNGTGAYVWTVLRLVPIIEPSGVFHAVVGCLQNIDEQKRHLENLTNLTLKDSLTDIYNRGAVERLSKQYLSEQPNPNHAMLLMDIDYFKQVNDQCGHAYGDEVLIRVARQVEQHLSPQTLFGRLGGDEFLIFIPNSAGSEHLAQLASRILQDIRTSFPENRGVITLSIGIALYQHCDNDFRSLYRSADCALYAAKDAGRDTFKIFDPDIMNPAP